MTLLKVEGLDVCYGKVRAVIGIDLAVNEGEIVTLVGINGAGKSSTIRAICENLLLGAYHRKDRYQVARDVETDLELFPHLRGRLDEGAYNLSGGELQMLALLRGMIARPRLLLLDEPSLGLAPLVVKDLFRIIRRLRDGGLTILLVEQNVRQALTLADRGYVMESGRVILSGKAQDLLADDRVTRTYLGIN